MAEDFDEKLPEDVVVDYASQFPNGGVERERLSMPISPRHFLRTCVVLYSGSVEGFSKRDPRKSTQERLYAECRFGDAYLSFQYRDGDAERSLSMPISPWRLLRARVVL